MDEPEVHLHPEWQIKLAEIAVLLQKSFGLNLIITTHSVEFLTAIDYFSTKYQIRDNCHFYLTETEKISDSESMARVSFRNVNKEMETMYTSISEPYLRI